MGVHLATRKLFSSSLFFVLVLNYFGMIRSGAPVLLQQEVNALKEIAKSLKKMDWNFSVDPCTGDSGWSTPNAEKGFENDVKCNCSFSHNTSCHVVSIMLKAQNLSGVLPKELHKLRFLQQVDLSRNFLTGTIPSRWATLNLLELSLMGNRLSGTIPKGLGKVTTFVNLSMEGNRFSGSIPQELGNLKNLERLVLASNELTGELPLALANLTNLMDFRISDNSFLGKIPDFIGRWTRLEKLAIQGSSLKGPIPSSISMLENLTDLRISDINGTGSDFPNLSKMKDMRTLMLRNCLIFGNIPDYIGEMTKLKNLDLSFNNLTGEIPNSFASLSQVDFMYLTNNMLSGSVPQWISKRNKNVDISYNNLSRMSSGPYDCPQGSINLVGSYSSVADNSVHPCLKKNFPCTGPKSKYQYSLHINCGGEELIIGNTTFEVDMEVRGASTFHLGQNWAFSSTGNFMDNSVDADDYIATNTTPLSISNSQLYTRARLSPLSLTYYGLCLMNGNYTVKLHFAEIIFTNDNTFSSLGRRIFDVYLQGKLVLKDFNIEDEAGGAGKAVVKNFTAVVTSRTLEIHFFWAGKGTQGLPNRGVYGPLISAISVDPEFEPPNSGNNISKIVAGVVASVLCLALLLLFILRRKGWLGGKATGGRDLNGLDLQTGSFTLRQIKAATKNFDAANKIGEGGFGSVYKGLLSDRTIVAVKQLSSKSKQGSREFVNEIGMISALQHPNLVKLYGCCVEGNQLLLVYEYMENNCLARTLFGQEAQCHLKLDWPTRNKICLGIARGLAYLHEESRLKIVHRDIKATNVLLDKDLNAKISDFGLAKLNEEDNTHISTRIAGTIGYMASEYAMRGYLTDKADVYSFGVVALEIVSGKSNTNYRPKEECVYLLDWACVLQERGSLLELVDPNLGSEFSTEEAMVMLNVALLCTNASPTLRPTMSTVVSMLEGRTPIHPMLSDPGFSNVDFWLRAVRNHSQQSQSRSIPVSLEGPCIDSSVSHLEDEEEESGYLLRASSSNIHLVSADST